MSCWSIWYNRQMGGCDKIWPYAHGCPRIFNLWLYLFYMFYLIIRHSWLWYFHCGNLIFLSIFKKIFLLYYGFCIVFSDINVNNPLSFWHFSWNIFHSFFCLFSLPISKELNSFNSVQSLQIFLNPNSEPKLVSLFENEETEKISFLDWGAN